MFNVDPTDDVIVDDTTDGGVTTDDGQADESGDRSAPGTQDVNDEVDDKGISYKNRFFETERKLENLTRSIPQMIQEAATVAAQQTGSQVRTQAQPEYTMNDYIAAKIRDPQNAAAYDAKIMELQKKEITETVKAELGQFSRQQTEAQVRQQAEAWAVNNFPQLRDVNNPFTQEVLRQFNSRPESKREPHDFAIAAELVAARMGVKPVSPSNTQQERILKQDRTVKKLLKERTLEGDARGAVGVSTVSQRQDDLKSALASGNLTAYIQKHMLRPAQSE